MYFLNALQVDQLKVIISLMLDKWLDFIYKREWCAHFINKKTTRACVTPMIKPNETDQ